MSKQYETIYLGRNNPFLYTPTYNGVALTAAELAEITKVEIKYKTHWISSASYPALFDWATYASVGKIWINIVGLDLTCGTDEDCEVIVYSGTYPTYGRIAGPGLALTVTDEAQPDSATLAATGLQISLGQLNDVDDTSATTGQILTRQADGSYAFETIAGSTVGAWGAATEKTITAGELALTGPGYYEVETEGGADTDDLDTITGLSDGDEAVLKPAAGRTITVKRGAGLKLAADFIMDSIYDRLRLQSIGGDVCVELSRANGAAD